MSQRQRLALIAAAVVVLVGGFIIASNAGNDDNGSSSTSTTTEATAPASTDTQATGTATTTTTGSSKTKTSTKTTTTTQAPASTTPPAPLVVVQDGKPQGGVKTLPFNKGETVRFKVRSDTADEVHVHGYDVKKNVAAGGTVTFEFKGTIDGRFVVELENAGEEIAKLQVSP